MILWFITVIGIGGGVIRGEDNLILVMTGCNRCKL